MKQKKIVLIGAGSAEFTQGLIADLIQAQNKGNTSWHLGLVDTDAEALETARLLSERMIRERDADIQISFSTDRRDILPEADVVVCTVAVGKRKAWEADVFIPRKYGIYQPVGDTVMVGGISRAMRMIPAMMDIARDVERMCPDAWFFNYSNPMSAICMAIREYTGAKVVGLCHGVNHTQQYLSRCAGLDEAQTTAKAVGLNHLTFVYDFRYKGKDMWPILEERLNESDNENFTENPFAWEMFKTYSAFPAPGDRHITEFFADRFPHGNYYGKTLGVDTFSFEKTIEQGDNTYEIMKKIANGNRPITEDLFKRSSGEHEQLMDIIDSLDNDKGLIYSANMPNNGAVPNLPSQALLEMPAIASARGFYPLRISDFPDGLAALLMKHIGILELTVQAAIKGNKQLFVEAVLAGGYMSNKEQVVEMVDELIQAHKQYLPQF